MKRARRILHNFWSKVHATTIGTGSTRTFLAFRLDISPFPDLFLFPQEFFTFPVRCSVAPKEEINIKTIANKMLEFIDHETHYLAGNRKTKVTVTLEAEPPRHD
jgi:hypothetical protein